MTDGLTTVGNICSKRIIPWFDTVTHCRDSFPRVRDEVSSAEFLKHFGSDPAMSEESGEGRLPTSLQWFRRLILLILGTAIGVAFTLLAVHRDMPRPRLGTAPEKFIPPQTLQLLDGKQHAFGSLELHTDGVMALDMGDATHAFFSYTTDLTGPGPQTPMLTLYGSHKTGARDEPWLSVQMEPEPHYWSHLAGGKDYHYYSEDHPHSTDTRSLAEKLVGSAYHAVFPEKPETSVEMMIPSEDARLVDREHRVRAVLGLSESGEPGIALMNREGRLVAILGISEPGFKGLPTDQPKQWPTLLLFDKRGAQRINVFLGPDPEPSVLIHEQDDPPTGTLYGLDPETGQEKPVNPIQNSKEGTIPWLAQPMPRVSLPITLIDQRGNVVWRSQ